MTSTRSQVWTLGNWLVKPGQEEEFRLTWEAFARWTLQHIPESSYSYLVQDVQESRQFYSFGPWANADVVAVWRATPEFQAFLAKTRELCERVEPHLLRLAAQAGHPA